jgi:membrane glycosyltransferase
MLLVLAGLLCGIALTVWTSHTAAGRFALRLPLLLVPEASAPPPQLVAVRTWRGSLAVTDAPSPQPHSAAIHFRGECSFPPTGL